MAIYHFSGTVISRSQGRSAVACAAYRSGERLWDERYAKDHDYTKKEGVVYTDILLPLGAPAWMGERESLWNTVEAGEKRKDAQLAREFTVSLPQELTLAQNIALTREFVEREFVAKGMVADVCLHADKTPDGEPQPHAHVMLTLREVTPQGFGQKVRDWNAKGNLMHWRAAWAEHVNRHLALHGHEVTIDHRTLKAQGIDLEPQYKIGAACAQARMARLADHQRIARENGEKLLANPQIALYAITRQQSTFTHHDLARFVNRHTVDAAQFQAVYETVKGHETLVSLGQDDRGRERFTTQGMLALETRMLTQAVQLKASEGHGVSEAAKMAALASRALTQEQQLAFEQVTSTGDLSCVVGYAGTGKSYLLGAAKEAWETAGYRVLGATLSGIAAENLMSSSGIESRTLASRCYYWDKGEQRLTKRDILVIDEAGMLGSRSMARVLEEAQKHGAKVVLLGDPEQLQAMEAGAAFRAISEQVGSVELTEVRRQREAWQVEATRALATGQTAVALERYRAQGHVHAFETQAMAQEGLIACWNEARLKEPDKTHILLAYTRHEVQALNERARQVRRAQGELGDDRMVLTVRGERMLAENDRIYFLKNDRNLGVMNGTLGTVEALHGQVLTVRLDGDERQSQKVPHRITVPLDHYPHIDHGYAATVHKAQGVTVDRSYLLASLYLDRHATYVALSRHREGVDIFYSRECFVKDIDFVRTVSRERAKDTSLDYNNPEGAFAKHRGLESKSVQRETLTSLSTQGREAPLQTKFRAYETLEAFKARFEAEHPSLALQHQASVLPSREPALPAEIAQFKRLQRQLDSGVTPDLKKALQCQADVIRKDPGLLTYVKANCPAIEQAIRTLTKGHERTLAHDKERERGGREL